MAGNYPDVPAARMALDLDGTQMYTIDAANTVTQLTAAQVKSIADEVVNGLDIGKNVSLLVYFPEKRDVLGYFLSNGTSAGGINGGLDAYAGTWSADTTNGVDGSWNTFTIVNTYAMTPAYRSAITGVNLPGCRAMKFSFGNSPYSGAFPGLHIFGRPSAGENPNRLRIWHPTLDQEVSGAYFDWGNVPRSSSADRTFRVKNNSATLTANSVTVAVDALTDTSPSVPGQHTLSSDGTTFSASASAGSLAPGAISGVLTLRRVTPSNAVLSLWAARLSATATSWT